MFELESCIVCGAKLSHQKTGRPRLYCSNRCRVRAQRQRRAAPVIRVKTDGDPPVLELSPQDILGPHASDPDEAVVACVLQARAVAAAFGVTADHARPQLGWRCEKMAAHIAAGLEKWFRP